MKFNEMNLDKNIVQAVEELGFQEATLIQERSIPILKEGKDLIAQSETGSGKTAAFGLPIIEKIKQYGGLQCVVLAPTRELAEQITKEFYKFSKYKRASVISVYGGVSINPQIERLGRADVVIATPGRMLDHITRGTINFSRLKFLVLDEADKMFEMGFIEDVRQIINKMPRDRQTMLFSATINQEIMKLARDYMRNPEKVKTNEHVTENLLTQEYYNSEMRDKFSLLLHLLKQENPNLAMIFCGTRTTADIVANNLRMQGVEAMALHGGHSQNKRNSIVQDFHSGRIQVLVATDIAARGLDIKNVTHIFNYDIPKTSQDYIHRIGRTARAGKSGKAISILCERDHENFRNVLRDRSIVIQANKISEFVRVPFVVRSENRFGPSRFGNRNGGQRFGPRRFGNGERRFGGNRQGEQRFGNGKGFGNRGVRR